MNGIKFRGDFNHMLRSKRKAVLTTAQEILDQVQE